MNDLFLSSSAEQHMILGWGCHLPEVKGGKGIHRLELWYIYGRFFCMATEWWLWDRLAEALVLLAFPLLEQGV